MPARMLLATAALLLVSGCAGLSHGPSGRHPQSLTASSATSHDTTRKTNRQPLDSSAASSAAPPPTIRGQDWGSGEHAPGSDDYLRGPMTASNVPGGNTQQSMLQPPAGNATGPVPPNSNRPTTGSPPAAGRPDGRTRAGSGTGTDQWVTSPYLGPEGDLNVPPRQQLPGTPVPLDVRVEEARTGRFMLGAGINSDAGVTGQITIDERNFDLFGFPTSWSEVWSGQAFRGRGQAFRLEAMPGTEVQRYLVNFTEPYLFSTPISLNVSGFIYDRGYFDWNESRAGGRLGLGYRLTPDLTASTALRMEDVDITNPRVLGVTQLDRVLGSNDSYSSEFSLRHDTRDLPFSPTEGHLIELKFEQAFGEFDYPRGEVDLRKYFLVRERPDGSGRHTLAANLGAGISGSHTPLFENYFAGGFSTIRGFEFRGASPVVNTVTVGGRFRMLGSLEYMMPLTADDMIKGVAFCDVGTVEQEITIDTDNFRVAPGFGFRISVPALGPAPLAFDFAFPVAKSDTDDERVFSFFFGVGRG
ncbi:MAG: BamA/TamA family outer membrane protein [Pirellulaceae bacterium]